jgi:DNA ligase (NAD+)
VIVERATLHNFDYILEKDIRVGDRVLVKRAGEVIPYVIGPVVAARTGKEKKYKLPTHCPSCGQPVERFEDEVAFYCVNAACPAQLVRNVEHFVSRGAMDIVGMGTRIVFKLIETGKVRDVADIYYLKRADILEAVTKKERKTEKEPPGKIAENLLASIEASKSRSLARLITALGIRSAGEVSATDLASHFTDLDALSRASAQALQQIAGIGPSVAESVAEWFARPANKNIIRKLKAAGVWPQGGTTASVKSRASDTFDGKTFVITGTLPTFSRDDAKEFIEAHGGKVTDNVSKKTSYLVLGEAPGSKYEKAKSLGVKIIGEEELKDLVK